MFRKAAEERLKRKSPPAGAVVPSAADVERLEKKLRRSEEALELARKDLAQLTRANDQAEMDRRQMAVEIQRRSANCQDMERDLLRRNEDLEAKRQVYQAYYLSKHCFNSRLHSRH